MPKIQALDIANAKKNQLTVYPLDLKLDRRKPEAAPDSISIFLFDRIDDQPLFNYRNGGQSNERKIARATSIQLLLIDAQPSLLL